MMSDFEYDCWQRKRLAQQAKYRKCGSKSKKCSMSTDHMTQKQWKERNGKVVTVNLNQPITWDEFKALTSLSDALEKIDDAKGHIQSALWVVGTPQ